MLMLSKVWQKWALGAMTIEQSFQLMDTYYDLGGESLFF